MYDEVCDGDEVVMCGDMCVCVGGERGGTDGWVGCGVCEVDIDMCVMLFSLRFIILKVFHVCVLRKRKSSPSRVLGRRLSCIRRGEWNSSGGLLVRNTFSINLMYFLLHSLYVVMSRC